MSKTLWDRAGIEEEEGYSKQTGAFSLCSPRLFAVQPAKTLLCWTAQRKGPWTAQRKRGLHSEKAPTPIPIADGAVAGDKFSSRSLMLDLKVGDQLLELRRFAIFTDPVCARDV